MRAGGYFRKGLTPPIYLLEHSQVERETRQDLAVAEHDRPAQEGPDLRRQRGLDVVLLALEQLLEEALALGQHDEADLLALADLRLLLREVEGDVEASQAVDEPVLLGLDPRPHPALGDGVDVVVGLAPALGGLRHEVLVEGDHQLAEPRPLLVVPRLVLGEERGMAAAQEDLLADPELVVQALEAELAAEHADGARDR